MTRLLLALPMLAWPCILTMVAWPCIQGSTVSGTSAPGTGPCSSPAVHLNGSRLRLASRRAAQAYVFQVAAPGSDSGPGQFCKLLCQGGRWRGPVCAEDPASILDSEFQLGCWLDFQPPGLQLRLHHSLLQLTSSKMFPHATTLLLRCEDPSQALDGPREVACQDGSWTGRLPSCRETAGRRGYTDRSPPRVRPVVDDQPVVLGRMGQIIVRPGSTLHLNCIQDRRRGSPQWSWSHSDKEYTTGWEIQPRKKNWFYRLDILSALEEDSGTYNCSNQRGLTNSVSVEVTSLTCPALALPPGVTSNITSDHLGTQVGFSCPPGFLLHGSPASSCRDDGTWSAPPPSCSPLQCPALEIASTHLRVLTLNNSYMGEATFDCPFGYQLTGDASIRCAAAGGWSSPVPACRPILCPAPPPPPHGQMLAAGEHYVGSVVRSSCQPGFVLVGEPVIRCTQEGIWSHSTPQCQRACRYPGAPRGGLVTPVRFLYSVGATISVVCHHGYLVTGSATVECLPEGEWSSPVLPACQSYLE